MPVARLVVGVSGVAAALFHAWLTASSGGHAWPTLSAIAIGLVLRAAAGAGPGVAAAMALLPIWPVIGVSLWPGSVPLEPTWPWLAFLIAVTAWPPREGWQAAGAWRLSLAGWGLVVAVTWPIVALRELDFTTATIGAVTVNGPTAGSPVATASFVALMSGAQIAALLLADWYAGRSDGERQRLWWALLPGVVAASATALWQQLVNPAFLSSEPWTTFSRSAGTLFDANATGALLALGAPALAAHLRLPAHLPPWVTTATKASLLVLAVGGVLATGSRTALAALVVGLVTQAVVRSRLAAWVGLAAVAVVLFTLAQRMPDELGRGQAAGRLAATVRRVVAQGPAGVWAFLRNRDGYGVAAREMIADHPWVGVGTGAFSPLVGSYGRTDDGRPLPADNAQNWWRHAAAESGLLGGAPAFAASLLLGIAAASLLWRREPAAGPIAGLALMGLVSPPTAHPIVQVLVGLLAAATIGVWRPNEVPGTPGRPAWAVWLLAGVCAAGTAVIAWRDLRPPYRAADFHFAYNYGTTDIVATPYGEGRWMGTRAVAVIPPTQSRTLITTVIAPHDDLAAHPVAIWISDRHRVICRGRVSDHTPLVCRVPVPLDEWPMLQVEVERLWKDVDGVPRAAVVSARFE